MFQLASSQPLGEETEVNPSSDEGEEDNAHKRASSAESQISKKIKLVKKPEMTDLLRQMMTENRRTEQEAQKKVGFLKPYDDWRMDCIRRTLMRIHLSSLLVVSSKMAQNLPYLYTDTLNTYGW